MKKIICENVSRVLGIDPNLVTVNSSSDTSRGDYCVPCFAFAKIFHKDPKSIASQIANEINISNVEHIEAINGYVNFFIKKDFIYNSLKYAITDTNYGSKNQGTGKTAFIEHTSINPNASPHIGRARNAFIGNAISNLLKFCGYSTEVHYFLNNIGKQIAMLVLLSKDLSDIKFEDFLGLYVSAQKKAETDEDFVKEAFSLLRKVEDGDKETLIQFDKVVSTCMQGQLKIFQELGITFDKFDVESDLVLKGSTDEVLQLLISSGKCFKDENNRWILDLNEEVPVAPFLPLTRADGSSLYALRDIAYTKWKIEQNADKNFVVLGPDQKIYYKQIQSALKLIGYTNSPELIWYEYVNLTTGKMSTRAGTLVLLEDLKKEAITQTSLSLKAHGNYSEEKAKLIAYATVLYSILKCSPEKTVTFDWASALSMDGNSALYIMYNYARIQSLKSKVSLPPIEDIDFSILNSEEEVTLLKLIDSYPEVINNAHNSMNVFGISQFIYKIVKTFSKYYSHTKIIDPKDNNGTAAKIYMITAVGNLVKSGLQILGIEVVNQI